MILRRAVLLIGLALGACRASPKSVPGLADLPVEWSPFRWVEATIGGHTIPQAAILVDSQDSAAVADRTAGSKNPFQLDFGFAGTAAAGLPLRLLETAPNDSTNALVLRGRIARLWMRDDSVGLGRPFRLGTLGLLFYSSRGLLIDFTTQRLGAPLRRLALPATIADRMLWMEAREDNGRLRIPLTWETTRLGDLLYDPGSSLVPFLVDVETWRQLTGRRETDPDLRRLAFPTATDSLVLLGAPPRRPILLGTFPLAVDIYTTLSGPAALARPPLGAGVVGRIGNQLFAGARLLYVNPAAGRVGVLR